MRVISQQSQGPPALAVRVEAGRKTPKTPVNYTTPGQQASSADDPADGH
jgi:hypothetical protein